MDKYWSVISLILIWGIGSGFGLKYSVPMMTDINDTTLLILSAAIPVMYWPGIIVYAWKYSIWWVLIVQILISLVAAIVSGYLIDTVVSYLLLGILSLITIYISTLLSNSLKSQISISFGIAFLMFTIANIYGHHLGDSGLGLLIKIITVMALCFNLCLIGTIKMMKL